MIGIQDPVDGSEDWRGPEINYKSEGLHQLSAGELAEIEAALAHLKARGDIDLTEITAEDFPLPVLGPFLAGLPAFLARGPGFMLLRGLSRKTFDADDMARIHIGLGAHLGRAIPQSHQGEVLGHVLDVSDIEPNARGYHAGGPQGMHSDHADIVALMCLRTAKSGGNSRIVSAAAVHNHILENRPDVLARLYGEFTFRRMKIDAERGSGILSRKAAIFSRASGGFTCNFNNAYIRRAVEAGDAVLTPQQAEALEMLKQTAASPAFVLEMPMLEGDIQFLNNRVLLHGRAGYQDWPEVARRRHMLRLWLEVPSWPDMPVNQGVHSRADHAGWLKQRKPLMDLPGRYLAEMSRRKAEKPG